MKPPTPLLELTGVTKIYDAPDSPGISVLKGLDLSVATGETVAIIGPSGSGKTSLLNLIGALDRPTTGQVILEGADISTLSDTELAAVRNRKIGFIFQLHHLLPQCTVLENVLVPSLIHPNPSGAADRARDLLERVGLKDRIHQFPSRLSGGELQRAAVIRALINRPLLVLADEPTGSLDHQSAEAIGSLLVDLNRQEKTTLVVVTHSPALAGKMSRILELRDGRLTTAGS